MKVGDRFKVIGPDSEAGLVGTVTEIPAKNNDAFAGLITGHDGVKDLRAKNCIGGTLSYPWELVEPYGD